MVNQVGDNYSYLPKILTPFETWGFGMSGHIVWIISAPAVFRVLGFASMYVWIPLVITSMISCFQIKRLATKYPGLSGGVPAYIYKLFPQYKFFSTYISLGWFIGWVMAFTVYGIIIVDSLVSILGSYDISNFYLLLVGFFSLIGFIVGFSSPKTLSILHLIFVVPTMFMLLMFSIYGLFWLVFSPQSPGFFPDSLPRISFDAWTLSTFFATYNIITMETEAVFTADSTNPQKTISFLPKSALMVIPVFLGGSYVLARLGSEATNGTTYEILNSVNNQLFGGYGSYYTILTVILCCLLSSASGVAIAPRVLYQLSKYKLLHKSLGYVNNQGVLVHGLLFCLVITIISIFLGGIETIFFSAGLAYLLTYTFLNYGLWFNRKGLSKDIFPRTSLAIALFYSFLIVVGGFLAGVEFILFGLFLPLVPIGYSWLLSKLPTISLFKPRVKILNSKNFVLNQILVVLSIVFLVSLVYYEFMVFSSINLSETQNLILIVVLMTLLFCSVAVASWTVIPQLSFLRSTQKQLHKSNLALEKDIAKREKLEKKLIRLSYTDRLTKLANRTRLEDEFNDFISNSDRKEFAMMFLDLDRFKVINDTFGHITGDRLLKQAAKRLKKIVGRKGLLVRLGGDEFVIFIKKFKTTIEVIEVIDRILEGFEQSFDVQNKSLVTTTSIGVVFGDRHYTSLEKVIRDADVAMYESKSKGRNTYTIFTDTMREKIVYEHSLEVIFRNSIAQNSIEYYFQPLFDDSVSIVGYEVLMRLEHNKKFVNPEMILEIANETGMITPFTWQQIENVCRFVSNNLTIFKDRYISINLAERVLNDNDFKGKLVTILKNYKISPKMLNFEILEHTAMNASENIHRNLTILDNLGCRLSIDDFGIGYSNFLRLQQLPITHVKIDKSLSKNLTQKGKAMLNFMLSFASENEFKVIVEGVETKKQFEILQDIGFENFQGYYFIRPTSSAEIVQTVKNFQKNNISVKN